MKKATKQTSDPKNSTAPPGFEIPGSATDDVNASPVIHVHDLSSGQC